MFVPEGRAGGAERRRSSIRNGGQTGVEALAVLRGRQKLPTSVLAMSAEQKLRNAVLSLLQTSWTAVLLWKTALTHQLQGGLGTQGTKSILMCPSTSAAHCQLTAPCSTASHLSLFGLVLHAAGSFLAFQASTEFREEGHIHHCSTSCFPGLSVLCAV